jgi:hypothetical protein
MLRSVSRLQKIFLGVVVVVAGLVLVLYVGANLFLKSSTVQDRLRQGTEASIGVPVEIRGISFTPWGGLALHDIRTVEHEGIPPQQSFTARALRIKFAWLPLLRNQLVITSIALDRPVMTVPEDQPVVLLPPQGRVEVQLPEDAGVSAVPGAEEVPEPGVAVEKSRPSFTVEVQRFQIRDGEVQVRSALGVTRLVLEGLNIQTKMLSGGKKINGTFRAESVMIPGLLVIQNLTAPFERSEAVLTVDDIRADWAGGVLAGQVQVDETTQDFEAELTIAAVSIPRLLEDAGLASGRTTGFIEGAFAMSGGRIPEDLVGAGDFFLREATLEPLDFMKQVGQLLRIEELQLLVLQEALVRVELAGQNLSVEQLRFVTDNLMILSEGRIFMKKGELDLQSRLMVSDNLQRSLGGLLTGFLQESSEAGYRELPFRIHGPLLRPRTDLLDRLGAGGVGAEVGRFLQNIFGRPSPPRKADEDE